MDRLKVAEIREATKGHKKEDLIYILVELYKRVPKAKIEEYDLNNVVKNPTKVKSAKKLSKKKVVRSLPLMQTDFENFIEHTDNGNYFWPNREISKKERLKWRFIAKRFYKEILELGKDPKNQKDCAEMMEKLMWAIKDANVSSGEPFASVQIDEAEFIYQVLALSEPWQDKREFIEKGLHVVSAFYWDSHQDILLEFLKTPDLKYLTIEKIKSIIEQETIKQPVNRVKKASYAYNRDKYRIKEKVNRLCGVAFKCYAQLFEFDEGIAFFKENLIEDQPKQLYFYLLRTIYPTNNTELFLKIVEEAKSKKIEIRSGLIKMYEEIKKTNKMPKYFNSSWH